MKKTYKKPSFSKTIMAEYPKPTLEITEVQIEKLKSYGQILLCILAAAGIVSIAVLMPSLLAAIKIFRKLHRLKRLGHEREVRKIRNTFYYLKNRGFIELRRDNYKFKVLLTAKGMEKVNMLNYQHISISKPKNWDGKFWQVAADIPTKHRSSADAFREKIKRLGLFPLQRTLWFYPFDLRKEIGLISRMYDIYSFVTVMKIDILDPADKKVIKRYFKEKKTI